MGLLSTQQKPGLLANTKSDFTEVPKTPFPFAGPQTIPQPNISIAPSGVAQSTAPIVGVERGTAQVLNDVGKALDYTSGAISQLPARGVAAAIGVSQPKSETFSEQALSATSGIPAPSPVVQGVGIVAGVLGDPLNLISGGASDAAKALKFYKLLAKTDDVVQIAKLYRDAGFAEDIVKLRTPMLAVEKDVGAIKKIVEADIKTMATTKIVSPETGSYLTEKYGKTIDSATGSQLSDALIETKGSILGESPKIGSVVKGLDKEIFQRKPDLLRGYQEGVVTDSYLLINDKEIAQKIIGDYITKKNELLGKRVGLSFSDVQKQIAADIANAAKGQFPKWREIVPDVSKMKSAFVQGNYSDGSKIFTVLSDGKNQAVFEANKFAFMRKHLPDTEILIGESGKPIVFQKGKDVKGLLMPIHASEGIPFKPDQRAFTATPTRAPTVPVAQGAVENRPIPHTPPEGIPSKPPRSTPVLVSPALKEVKQIPEEIASPFKQAVENGSEMTKEPTLFKRVTTKLGNAFRSTVEYVQDSETRVLKLLERSDITVTESSNVYQKSTAYPGRVASKIEDAHAEMETLANNLVTTADKSNRDVSLVRQDVNEYLQAVHAPERNAVLGDGAAGMTDAVAKATVERINALPEAAAIQRMAQVARKLNEQGLILLKNAGVISEDLFAKLTTTYKNHVPLNRIFDGDEIQGALSIRGYDVRSTGIKRAKGSEREVADILSNIQHNYEQAVLRSEKNIVDQATLAFVRENRDALKGLMDVRKPRAIGKSFDDHILMERTTDPSYLQLYENGKPIWIKIHDPTLALAFKGIGREKLPTLLNAIGAFTRFYAGLATRFNPEFAFPNKLRDLQETMIYMAAQKDVGFKGAVKVVLKDPASTKAVWDSIRGLDSAGARQYAEMKSLGGTTGGFGLSTRKQVELDLDKMIETAQSRPKQTAQAIVQYVDNWNTVFEDSTRLSVYKQALSQGLSKERAAFLAKEASINFNRMGRGGPVINALWMFSNASIQGSAKMIRSLRNPKVAAAVITTVGAATAAVNEWNDRIDPQWRDKVTKWDRLNGLPIVLPNAKGEGVNYITIPVSWGVKPIKVMADYAYDAASGQETDLKKMASDLFTSTMDAYNPLGGTNIASTLTPTIIDVPVEVAMNMQWSGAKIRPDFDKNAPKDVQYFSTLRESISGRVFIEGTRKLQAYTGIALSPADINYGYQQYIGGAGKFINKTVNAFMGLAIGKPVSTDQYPFISRFFRGRTEEELGLGAGGDTQILTNQLQNQSREKFYATQAAEDAYTRMKTLSPQEASAQWSELYKTSPTIAAKIADIAKQEKKGLTYTDRLVLQLGVASGERARYIYEKLAVMKSNDDKSALWQSYVTKGIITDRVADQISYLLKNKP